MYVHGINEAGNIKFGFKVDQIDPKWDKSGTFSDQISVHFDSVCQNVLKCYLNYRPTDPEKFADFPNLGPI